MEQEYNVAKAMGYIRKIGAPYYKGEHTVVDMLMDCETSKLTKKNRQLHIKAWDVLAHEVLAGFTPGNHVQVMFTVYSHQNKNNSDLYYHTLTLREITKD